MKFPGWMLLITISLSTLHAQEVIESTPLSIEDDGARKLIDNNSSAPVIKNEEKEIIKIDSVEVKPESLESVDNATKKEVKKAPVKVASKKVKTPKTSTAPPSKILVSEPSIVITPVVVVPENTNPVDGKLKLNATTIETSKEIKVEDRRIDEAKIVTLPAKAETIAVVFYDNTLKRYLQYSFGYIDSDYEKIHSGLDNGSNISSLAFVSDMTSRLQGGLSMELITDKSGQKIPDSIRSVQYRIFANYHAPIAGSSRIDWVSGLSLVVGDYGIRRRYINLQGEEASLKIKEGTLFGLVPAAGVRIYLVGRTSFDIMAEYHQYFGKTQRYIGGLAIAPRLSFEF